MLAKDGFRVLGSHWNYIDCNWLNRSIISFVPLQRPSSLGRDSWLSVGHSHFLKLTLPVLKWEDLRTNNFIRCLLRSGTRLVVRLLENAFLGPVWPCCLRNWSHLVLLIYCEHIFRREVQRVFVYSHTLFCWRNIQKSFRTLMIKFTIWRQGVSRLRFKGIIVFVRLMSKDWCSCLVRRTKYLKWLRPLLLNLQVTIFLGTLVGAELLKSFLSLFQGRVLFVVQLLQVLFHLFDLLSVFVKALFGLTFLNFCPPNVWRTRLKRTWSLQVHWVCIWKLLSVLFEVWHNAFPAVAVALIVVG